MIRRIFNLATLLFLFFFVVGVKAQQQLTVYDGMVKNPNAPVNIVSGNYATKSQYVIPAAELYSMYNGYIDSLSFYPNETNKGAMPYTSDKDVCIYIKEVDYTEISKFEELTDDNLVFKGKIYVTKDDKNVGHLRIKLAKPYHYKGGNLLIASEATEEISSKLINFFGSEVKNACYAMWSNHENKYDFIPKTTFTYYTAPTITDIVTTPTTATVSWTDDAEKYKLRYTPVEFFDDFENGIDRWTVIRNGEGVELSDWRLMGAAPGVSEMYAHSGSNTIRCRSYADRKALNVDNWIISPKIKLDGTLKYWVRDDGVYHEHYEVYVSTTDAELASFKQFAIPGDATSEWTEVSIDLSSLAGQEGYIAFRNTDYDKNYLLIDDVGIYPSNASWTEVADATSPYTLNGLTEDVTYYIQASGVFLENYTTSWAGETFFTNGNPTPTDVAVIKTTAYTASVSWKGYGDSYDVHYRNIIFSEDFESNLDAWTLQNCVTGTSLYANALIYHSGNLGFAFKYTKNPPQYLISKEISNIPEGSRLSFYYRNSKKGQTETFAVGYSSTDGDVESFKFGEEISIADSEWVLFDEAIPVGTRFICIKHTSNDMYYLAIDDLLVYQDVTTVTGVNELSTTITGLSGSTKYDFCVRSRKGEKVSEWTDFVGFATVDEQVLSNLFNGNNVWTTYIATNDVALPEGLAAYMVSSLGNTSVNAEPVDYLPKDVPVLLKRVDTTVNTYKTDLHFGAEPDGDNLLKAADESHQPMAHLDYVLYNDEFVLVSGGTLADGLVFLSVPKNHMSRAATRSIVIGGSEDDDTTGIEFPADHSEDEVVWFDLSGRKIAAPTRKGIYIRNGKKVVVH